MKPTSTTPEQIRGAFAKISDEMRSIQEGYRATGAPMACEMCVYGRGPAREDCPVHGKNKVRLPIADDADEQGKRWRWLGQGSW